MKPYTEKYLKAFGFTKDDFVPCEICKNRSTEIHHIERQGSFGSKKKDKCNDLSNLIALCRECHNKAHSNEYTKDYLKHLILNRN
jgi:5-methylcytosine-specific restriction endonuclease McrA